MVGILNLLPFVDLTEVPPKTTLFIKGKNNNVQMSLRYGNESDWSTSHPVLIRDDVINDGMYDVNKTHDQHPGASLPMDERIAYFYISLAVSTSATLLLVIILVLVYQRGQRNMSSDGYSNKDGSVRSNLINLKGLPSIQIETVDDDGNVKVELYSTVC